MSVTHTISRTLSVSSGGTPVNRRSVINADSDNNIDEVVAAGATNKLIQWACLLAKLQSLVIDCDQAITIKTNSSGSPAQTLTIPANQPLVWVVGDPVANPITTNVTALYVTNAGGTDANLKIYKTENT